VSKTIAQLPDQMKIMPSLLANNSQRERHGNFVVERTEGAVCIEKLRSAFASKPPSYRSFHDQLSPTGL
jgi:hypothetical protein